MIELLDQHISRFQAEKKVMFGAPCYFIHGNMFAGIFSNVLFARLSIQDRERLDRERLGDFFEPVQGRRMNEYRTLGRKVLEDPKVLDAWLERSYSYASSLKPK
ncbi:MAG: TfoX/Sxy family protein [Methanomassiliicoccales archaeon]|nr:TfoX/Sxy family protein [Methanomassiliicoccales archaeon]